MLSYKRGQKFQPSFLRLGQVAAIPELTAWYSSQSPVIRPVAVLIMWHIATMAVNNYLQVNVSDYSRFGGFLKLARIATMPTIPASRKYAHHGII